MRWLLDREWWWAHISRQGPLFIPRPVPCMHAYTTNSELCVRVCSSAVIYLLPSIEQNIGNECMQKTIHSKRRQRPTATTTKRCWWWRQQQQRQLKAHTYIRIWNFLSVHKSWLCRVSRFHFKIELQGKAKSREEEKNSKVNEHNSLTHCYCSQLCSAQLDSTHIVACIATVIHTVFTIYITLTHMRKHI